MKNSPVIQTVIFLFCILSTTASWAQKSKLKEGDLLFINIDCGEMCNAINAVTSGYKNQKFNHMGMVTIEKNQYFVYEAIGESVTKTPLKTFLSYTTHPIYKARLKKKYTHLIPKSIAFCKQQIGTPYDNEFLYNNGKYYCSELIYDAFLYANNQKPVFELLPMNYKTPNSEEYFPVWIEHFNKINMPIPQGKLGCNPGGMSLSNKIKISIFRK